LVRRFRGHPSDDPTTAARAARVYAAVEGHPLAITLGAARLPFLSLASLEAMLSPPGRALSV